MPQFGKWVLTLGLMAATPAAAVAANPLTNIFKKGGKQPAAGRTNQQVAEDIARALRSARLNRFEMDVEYSKGVCRLTGKVATPQQKAQATRICSQVAGVQRVDNQLKVLTNGGREPFSRLNYVQTKDGRGVRRAGYTVDRRRSGSGIQLAAAKAKESAAAPSNQQVAEAIAKQLKSAGLSGYDMEIRYQNGVAQLAGSVSSPQQRAQAEQIVSRVPGVRKVDNQLRVARADRQTGRPMVQPAAAYQPGAPVPAPQAYGHPGAGARHTVYNQPHLPKYSWPTYASYPNYSQLTYPKQYSASAWPYIGPFYPYPQVPMGWRKATLEWDDGYWALSFNSRTDRWWWFLNPQNW